MLLWAELIVNVKESIDYNLSDKFKPGRRRVGRMYPDDLSQSSSNWPSMSHAVNELLCGSNWHRLHRQIIKLKIP